LFKDIKRFFADFISRLRKSRSMKYAPLIAIPCLLAILIPTLFAVWHVYFNNEDTHSEVNNVSVTLYDADGLRIENDTVLETNMSDSAFVDIFRSINSETKLDQIPADRIEKPNYKLAINHYPLYVEYQCYFTSDPATSYLCADDVYYSVDPETYVRFLNSEYSEAAYPESTPPTLRTKASNQILPSEVYWNYRKENGDMHRARSIDTAIKTQEFVMGGSISIDFEKLPDACSVRVTDSNGHEIYEGDFDQLAFITVKAGTLLNIKMSASWSRSEECDSYGRVDYDFRVMCKNYASFEISSTEVAPGEFVIISASDVESGASVTYSLPEQADAENNADSADKSALSTQEFLSSVTPVFSYSGDKATALLPIPYDTPSGTMTFSISSGAASKEFTITIKERDAGKEVTLTKSKKVINSVISDEALQEVYKLITDISAKGTDKILFRGAFGSFESNGLTRGFSYGDRFIIGDVLNEKFTALGNDYTSAHFVDANVYSLNIGRVTYTGYAAHLGNFAVVDHGMGIATWYCHLSSIDCSVGDVVAKGELIGKCGNGIMLESTGTMLLCTVYDTIVDPDSIQNKEIISYKTQVSGGTNDDVK
jgi:murein DD-endopeptidase MepM/ murein hydrolase activator NlpD